MAAEASSSAATASASRKPLFKKSLFAKPPPPQSTGVDLFSRSKETIAAIIAERENDRLRKDRKKSRTPARSEERETTKRRRVSEEGEFSSDSSTSESEVDDPRERRSTSTPACTNNESIPILTPETSNSPRNARLNRQTKAAPRNTISPSKAPIVHSLDDSDGEPSTIIPKTVVTVIDDDLEQKYRDVPAAVVEIKGVGQLSDDDEEFPELAAAARARANAAKGNIQSRLEARLAQLRKSRGASGQVDGAAASGNSGPAVKTEVDDPVVKILITARIVDSTPLLLHRKMSQRLKDVRQFWCDKQEIGGYPLSKEVKDSFFLTFRGRKLFDSTTCRALGVSVKPNGELADDGDGLEEGRIHLEAWTEELYQTSQKELEEIRRKEAQDPQEQEEEEEVAVPVVVEEVTKVAVILSAKGLEDVKLRVRPTTKIQQMINKFRKDRGISEDRSVVLRFDGDELDPDTTVEEAEIEDLTKVDVYIN